MNLESLTTIFQIAVLSLAVIIGVFLALRYLLLWYFRINEIVDLLKKQTELLETIAAERRPNVSKPIITKVEQAEPPATQRQNPLTRK